MHIDSAIQLRTYLTKFDMHAGLNSDLVILVE